MDEIKKVYNLFKKKYKKLPKYNELNREFEISNLEVNEFFLKEIIRKIEEKINNHLRLLESFMQPDSSFIVLNEIKNFNDKDQKKLSKLFNALMIIDRKIILTLLECNTNKEVDFIIYAYNEWMKIKEDLISFVKKLIHSWEKEYKTKVDLEYFG